MYTRPPLLWSLLLAVATAAGGPAQAQLPGTLLEGLAPRAIGPAFMGGRTVDFAVYEEDPAIFYAATASGGLLKTENGGTSWVNVFEDQPTVSIGAVAIEPNNPDVVWVGTGEANNRQSSSWGDGIYKSTDGGDSWQHMGLRESHHIGRILVHPQNPNVVYVAALGHLWGANPERGLYMTTDGGRNWQHVLRFNEDTGVVDVAMDPSDPNTLYAAAYQRRRSWWGFNGGGPHGGIHKSTDGGRTWRELTNGLPQGDIGRIGLSVYRANPNIVYAIVQAEDGGVFRSENKGESWTKVNDYNPRPMYYSQIRVDPTNDQRVYILGTDLHVSDDAVETHEQIGEETHSDHHGMWIDPNNPRHLIVGNDGGIWVSRDRGDNWEHLNNYPMGQFYSVAVDMQQPYHVYGGMQDNATWGGPSAVRDRPGIANEFWYQILSCDGEAVALDPADPEIVYTNCQNGRIVRYDKRTGERKPIQPEGAAGEDELRWNWTSPIVASIHAPGTLYTGSNIVFRSTDRGHSWTAISPDLTRDIDRDTVTLMGVRVTDETLSGNDGMSSNSNLTALAESPMRAGLLYAGSDDGRVHVTRDGGRTWTDLTARFPGKPEIIYVSRLTPSAFEEGTVYASFEGHRSDDMAPYVYASNDYGQTWRSISAGLPTGSVYVIREDPKNPNLLHLGTEFALFSSLDRGASWTEWGSFPTVAVFDLVVHPRDNDLVLGTHGRSFLVYDDISPLQQMSPTLMTSNVHLFDIRPATQFIFNENSWFLGGRDWRAENPEFGAYINYYLRSPVSDATITIRDGAGNVVRTFEEAPTEAGLNRVGWDLRAEPFGELGTGLAGQFNIGELGPFVIPGDYRVTLSAGGQELTKTVRVHGDPLVQMTSAERQSRYGVLVELTEMQRRMESLMERVEAMSDGERKDELNEDGGSLRQRVNRLKSAIIGSQSPPTQLQMRAFEGLPAEVQEFAREVEGSTSRAPARDAA